MSDLAAFLRACLDADEAAARAALPPRRIAYPTESRVYEIPPNDAYTRHTARHDPTRVLADVAAKRRILELHEPPVILEGPGPWACLNCDSIGLDDPCLTLRLLAQPYEGEDGWDDAWKVS